MHESPERNFSSERERHIAETEKERMKGITVFRVRHGTTALQEQEGVEPGKEFELTDRGTEEVKAAAEEVAAQLDADQDVVWVVSSPRKRTRDSADIFRQHLKEKGFTVWEDPKQREEQNRVRSTDFYSKEGDVIEPDNDEYASSVIALLRRLREELPENADIQQEWAQGALAGENIEQPQDVAERSRGQLALLMRIAHTIQPKLDKHIVIIQTEHTETMDELLERSTNGTAGAKVGEEAQKGEVLKLEIPSEGNKIDVSSLTHDRETHPVYFDHLKRKFTSDE